MSEPDAKPPAPPHRVKIDLERTGQRLVWRSRAKGWSAALIGCFLVVWFSFWTIGCAALAYQLFKEPSLFSFLFALPFWAFWGFVFFMLLHAVFGHEEFVFDHHGATYCWRVLLPVRRWFTPLNEIRTFAVSTSVDADGDKHYALEMQTAGRSQQFHKHVGEEDACWAREQLSEHFELLKQAIAALAASGEDVPPPSELPPALEPGESRRLELTAAPVAPPSDNRWNLQEELDDLRFIQFGRLSWTSLGWLVFLNLFWNGGILLFAVAIIQLIPGPPMTKVVLWIVFLLLLPLERIGLELFAKVLTAIMEPVRRTTWTFARASIQCRWQWLGVGRTWDWPADELDHAAIYCHDPSAKAIVSYPRRLLLAATNYGGANYRLVLIDRTNVELCAIDNLTQGESHWIGDVLLRQRSIWFRMPYSSRATR